LYGLLGTTVISFSDVLGNHRIIGVTSLQIDLKNSDYGLAYQYLPERVNYSVEAFHTARFVFLTRGFGTNLFRFRNYGAVVSMSYPLNRFYRLDGGLSWLNVSSENLDNPLEETDRASYILPNMSFVHDNVLWGYTSPVEGSRYRFDVFGNPGISERKLSFYSVLGDYRKYLRFWTEYSFAFRLSGGYSGGANPQRFFIGGIENWINRDFATTDIPLESASDFAFLTAALPPRGFDYAERIGTRYALMNLELRFPLIRYLVTGALPILFSNIHGVAFLDMGAAWNESDNLRFFQRNAFNQVVTRDLLMGTGVGARIFFLYFLLRFDVAWAYNVDSFSEPKFYISLGADF
jgi:outer membrane protein assembly factor BamA